MQVTKEELNPCTVRLTVVCEQSEVSSGFNKAIKQISKQIKVPGFRPGNAPKSMVEQMINPQDIIEKAADIIIRDTFTKAIEAEKLEMDRAARPSVELKSISKEENTAEYTVKVPLPPKVELGDYKGLEVDMPRIEVSDEEVVYQLDELRKRRGARETIADRGAEQGDIAVVNVKIEGETGDGKNFMTIVGQTFPQLDAALSGMEVEDLKKVELTFPETFQEKDWAGKTIDAIVSINSLSAVRLPELDDEFAQSLSTESVDDLKVKMRQSIEQAKSQMVAEMVQQQLIEKLKEKSTVNVSDNLWEALAMRRLQEVAEEQQKAGKTIEQYAQAQGMTMEQFQDNWNTTARHHVENALIIRTIFEAEKMQLVNEELNQELFFMAGEHNMKPEELLEILRKNESLEELHFRAIQRKVSDFLLSQAKVSEVTLPAPGSATTTGSAVAPAIVEKPKAKRAKKTTE